MEGIEGALLIGANLILWPLLRSWRLGWGATDEELKWALVGDELVPQPKWSYTQAITIRASAEQAWPWLVQMGQGRGGFYSYEWLENLIGCDTPQAQCRSHPDRVPKPKGRRRHQAPSSSASLHCGNRRTAPRDCAARRHAPGERACARQQHKGRLLCVNMGILSHPARRRHNTTHRSIP